MYNIILGILLIVIGVIATLEQINAISVLGSITWIWSGLVFLIGLSMILREQSRMMNDLAKRKLKRKLSQQLNKEHSQKIADRNPTSNQV